MSPRDREIKPPLEKNRREIPLEGVSNKTYSFGLGKEVANGGATYAEGVVLAPRVV